MKKVSAKVKLTLFTALLMLVMAGVLIGLMFTLSENIISSNSRDQLQEVVDDNSGELEFDDGGLDTDDVDFFKKGVYTVLYSYDGQYITGDVPEEGLDTQPLKDKETTEITVGGTRYYIYDILFSVEGSDALLWMRGIIAVDEVATATSNILQMAIFSLPVFILLAALGSYFVAKHTFRPIDKIVKTAEEISESENLALRIDLKGGSPEIYKLAETFDKMFERLEEAFEAEKQFTSDVSHELRTPTAVIMAQCEYAIGEKITLEDKEDALETVQRQAVKMSNLISELLNLIRLDRGVEKVEFKKINLSDLVREACEEHQLIAPIDINMTYEIAPNINGAFDEAMITRLLANLLSNAFRYRSKNGNVEVLLSETDEEIVLSIKDDGIGIAREHQSRIWQRFYQVDRSRTESQKGSMGLGLAMVAQIVKLHHARIELESEVGEGCLFNVKFPK